jgi:peptidylprolyl isomerase
VIFSSEDMEENAPTTFGLTDLLPSLSRAMVGMLPGEKRKIYVHPNLAYGKLGHFPPNSLLIMEIQLLKIVKKKEK